MEDLIHMDLGGGACLDIPFRTAVDAVIERLSSAPTQLARPALIGTLLPSQGGIYLGDILGDDGIVYGLIMAENALDGRYAWGPEDGEREASDWDGLTNTNALLRHSKNHPAARAANAYSAGGHADFYLPAKREFLIAAANVPHLFGKELYWTSTPCGSHYAWAVVFEYGYVSSWSRLSEFLVRPFRRFTY